MKILKIKKLDIYGYGKWLNQSFTIDDQIQLFFGRNESGKSTLQSFIRSILFGFPTRRKRVKQQNRYEPKHSDVYGGRILLTETEYGDVWIERTGIQLSLTASSGEKLDPELLQEILGGMDESLFYTFYAFSLNNMQELANIGADQLNDYFLSIGTLGSDKFLKIAKDLEKETNDLFKPKGKNPPINQMLEEYEGLSQQVERAKESMDRYEGLVREREKIDQVIHETNTQLESLENNLRAKDKLSSRYDIYLKSLAAEKELKELVYTDIPDTAPQMIKEAQQSSLSLEEEILTLEERLVNIKDELSQLTRYNWAQNHEEERKHWMTETEKIKEIQTKIEQTNRRIQETNEAMMQLAHRGQFYPEKISDADDYQAKVDKGLVLQTDMLELNSEIEAIRVERKILLEQRKNLQNRSANLRQQVAKLENQRVNEEEILIQKTALSEYVIGLILLAVGIFIIVFNMMRSSNAINMLFWIGLLMTVFGVIASGLVFVKHRQLMKDFEESPILGTIEQLKDDSIQVSDQSKELGIEINQREDTIEELEADYNQLHKDQSRWLTSIGFYPTADPEIILKTDPASLYFEEKNKRYKYEEELKELKDKVEQWNTFIQPLLDRFPIGDTAARVIIRHVEEVEASLIQAQQRGNSLNERLMQTAELIEKHQQKIKQNQALIQEIYHETGVRDQMEFNEKYEINQRINDLNQKNDLYKEQIIGYETELGKIENKQKLTEELNELEKEITVLKGRLEPHLRERANLTVEINHIEQDGTYQDLVQQQETKKARLLSSIQDWTSKRLAMDIIYQTLRKGLDNPVVEMNEVADHIFQILSYQRYNMIKMNKNNIKVKHISDVLFEPHELSQGTLEQLYVALRLAFVISAQTMIKMPIMIDDAFVNFDEFRKESMYKVLKEVSKDIQVLFFTFDQQAKDSFEASNIIHLEDLTTEEELSLTINEDTEQ